jgi:hypothetical protein
MTPEQIRKFANFASALTKLKAKHELGQPADLTPDETSGIIYGIQLLRAEAGPLDRGKTDTVFDSGEHKYWSTHCRHERHADCSAQELAPGHPRRPAQCKTCASPCTCSCHHRERP